MKATEVIPTANSQSRNHPAPAHRGVLGCWSHVGLGHIPWSSAQCWAWWVVGTCSVNVWN